MFLELFLKVANLLYFKRFLNLLLLNEIISIIY